MRWGRGMRKRRSGIIVKTAIPIDQSSNDKKNIVPSTAFSDEKTIKTDIYLIFKRPRHEI